MWLILKVIINGLIIYKFYLNLSKIFFLFKENDFFFNIFLKKNVKKYSKRN